MDTVCARVHKLMRALRKDDKAGDEGTALTSTANGLKLGGRMYILIFVLIIAHAEM